MDTEFVAVELLHCVKKSSRILAGDNGNWNQFALMIEVEAEARARGYDEDEISAIVAALRWNLEN